MSGFVPLLVQVAVEFSAQASGGRLAEHAARQRRPKSAIEWMSFMGIVLSFSGRP
jgi:hypothetical protein